MKQSIDNILTTKVLVITSAVLFSLLIIAVALTLGIIGISASIVLPIGAVVIVALLVNNKSIIYLSIVYSVVLGTLTMLVPSIPVGILMDLIISVGFFGFLLRAIRHNDFEVFASPMAKIIYVWIGYHIFQLFNPWADSRVAWFYTMRPFILYPLMYFITAYILKNRREWLHLFYFFISIMALSGVWGLFQLLHGYMPFEMSYLQRNDAIHLVYIQGRWRIFGTLLSPAQFGVAMAILAQMVLVLLINRGGFLYRVSMLFLFLLLLMLTVFSGTRSAMVILPVSIAVWVLMSRNLKVWGLAALAGVCFIILLYIPIDNYHINRIQSAFKPGQDKSLNVRLENRRQMYPWILKHPIGGGLGSTGVWGMRFSPNTRLARFAPDSGYLRVATELGWIGLIIYFLLWYKFLSLGVKNHWKVRDPHIRYALLAIVTSMASLIVVEWVQDIIGKVPFNLLFWILAALITTAPSIDTIEHEKKDSADTKSSEENPYLQENEDLLILMDSR